MEVTAGSLWPLMRAAEERGVFFYPFTGAGVPRTEGLVVAPLMTLFEIGHPLLRGDPTPARDSPVWSDMTSVVQGAGLFLG
ncbi:hypothetical protein ACI2LJ_30885 [Streptomyces sp. NPDC088090]|uniref:hypothetical protein n=1 Tax=Streptomyces sp. NPDC088090 TaxID=3365822 RepID=UPI00384B42F3